MKEAPLLITDIPQLATLAGPRAPRGGRAMSDVGLVKDGAVLVENGLISAAGPRAEVEKLPLARRARRIEAGGAVIPAFCDSHTHPVFTSPRLNDFSLRIRGASYADIKKAGGGILSSINGVRDASENELAACAERHFRLMLSCGTASVEAKSGYGLSLESELKSLRAIAKAASRTGLDVQATLLAAHSIPPEFEGDAEKYSEYVIKAIIPAAARARLAVFADVFCEKGYFSPKLSARIMRAAAKAGLKPKFHAEQLNRTGGALEAARAGAVSADHLDCVNRRDMAAMRRAGVCAVLLPASNYFLGMGYPPARKMIDGGLAAALATDFNPGTSPCWNMQFVLSLACTQLAMTPEEALCAATINGAYAMGLGGLTGSLEKGKQADLLVLEARDFREAAYYFGGDICGMVMKKGRVAHGAARRFN